ncbi:MAG: hypothetical protein WA906_08320 [Pacificimonas sp.]
MIRMTNIVAGLVTIGAGLGLYMSSYAVAAERDRIEALEVGIATDQAAIERLQAELGVRASLTRLEEINASVWNLKTPSPVQIVGGPVQFASYLEPEDEAVGKVMHAVVTDDDSRTDASDNAVVLAATAPEAESEATAVAQAPVEIAKAPSKVVLAEAVPAPAPVQLAAVQTDAAPVPDLFSDDFVGDIRAAAQLEQAGFQKVSLR